MQTMTPMFNAAPPEEVTGCTTKQHPLGNQHQEKIGLLFWNCCRNPIRWDSFVLKIIRKREKKW